MSSFLDFCLHCDTQTSGAAYCSQRCRLLDMDSSPTLSSSSSLSPASDRRGSIASTHSGVHGFYLSPPFDFAAYRTSGSHSMHAAGNHRAPNGITTARSTASSRPTSICSLPGQLMSDASSLSSSSSARSSVHYAGSGPRLLPTASRNSLSAFETSWGAISRNAREELREYGNSFDTVRDLRRRITMT